MVGRKRFSQVWEIFDSAVNGTVQCKICSTSYKFSGNTTTLMNHIKKKHPGEHCLVNNKNHSLGLTEPNQIKSDDIKPAISSSNDVEPSTKRLKQSSPITAQKFFQVSRDDALINMIAKDYQPLQFVENEGFRKFSIALNADYELPSKKKLSLMLEEKFNNESAPYKEKLQDVEHIALTSDVWTSDNNKSFISMTAHFINESKLQSIVISTLEMQESRSAQNIANAIHQILDQWQINSKVVTIVTDNASSMEKVVTEILKKEHHVCVAHTLRLAVKDCMEKDKIKLEDNTANNDLLQILNKCRAIVSHFKSSKKSSNALVEIQKELNLDVIKLKQDVSSRWNNTFCMLESLLNLKFPFLTILPTLQPPPPNLDSQEWLSIEDVVALLHPFEKVAAILSAEKYPLLSSVIPLVLGLQNTINRKVPVTEIGKDLQNNLANVIETRLGVYETNKTAAKATFLDPRFKKKGFSSEINANNAQVWIIKELQSYISEDTLNSPDDPSTSTTLDAISTSTTEHEEDEIWGVVDRKISETVEQVTTSSSAAVMVKLYIELPYLDRKQDPLQFWTEKKTLFPMLYNLANKYLCIPATSVPSERLFSKAGILSIDRRNQLPSKKLNEILFLNTLF